VTQNQDPDALARADTLGALPAVFTFLRGVVSATAASPEREELRTLIEACVVGAHRLKLAEQLRAREQ
jgi:hypothetical protein